MENETNRVPAFEQDDPGLDLHDWETRWQQLQALAEDDPAEALPEIADLVESILREAGFGTDRDVAAEGDSPDFTRGLAFAREVADRVERGESDPGDVGAAHEALRDIYTALTAERPS